MRTLLGLYKWASHSVSNSRARAKTKKWHNIKYDNWETSQINRAYHFAGREETKYCLKAVEDMWKQRKLSTLSFQSLFHVTFHNYTIELIGLWLTY